MLEDIEAFVALRSPPLKRFDDLVRKREGEFLAKRPLQILIEKLTMSPLVMHE